MALQAQPPPLTANADELPHSWVLGIALVGLSAVVTLASYVTSDPTHNDFERFGDLRLLFVFFALFAGLCAVYVAAYTRRQVIPTQTLWVTTLLCLGVVLASFPVGSKDVFGYAFLGRMWGTLHANPYVTSPLELQSDPWFPSLVGTLRRPLSVYGPLFMWQSWLVNALAGDSLWRAVWLHKAVATVELLGILFLAQRIVVRLAADAPPSWVLLLLAWNPLFLFEAAGAAHNDVAMALLLLAAIWCWSTDRCTAALACLALSVWYKWYSLIFVPAFLIEAAKTGGLRVALRQALVFALWTGASGIVLLSPLHGALPSIAGQLLHPEKMRGIFPNELSPPLALLFWSLRAVGLFVTDRGFDVFNAVRLLLAAAAVTATVVRQWRVTPSATALIESCALTGLAFFMLIITQLWPWHVLTVVATSILSGREPFIRIGVVLSVLALLSNFLTFAIATLLVLLVVVAVWLMRRSSRGSEVFPAVSAP